MVAVFVGFTWYQGSEAEKYNEWKREQAAVEQALADKQAEERRAQQAIEDAMSEEERMVVMQHIIMYLKIVRYKLKKLLRMQ